MLPKANVTAPCGSLEPTRNWISLARSCQSRLRANPSRERRKLTTVPIARKVPSGSQAGVSSPAVTRVPLLFCCFGGSLPDRRGSLRMPAIIIALTRFCGTVQAFLHRGLAESFVVLQINNGLFLDIGEIAVAAGERPDASLAGEFFMVPP